MHRRLFVSLLLSLLLLLATLTASAVAAGPRAPGDIVWDDIFAPTANQDDWTCAATGPDGSLYVAGGLRGSIGDAGGLMVARYAANGVRLWTFTYELDNQDAASDIAVDGAGSVYVVGTASAGIGGDMLVFKLSPAGVKRWEWRLGSVGAVPDGGTAIALDATGNVYAAGWQTNPGTGQDLMVAQLTRSGRQRYRSFYRGSGTDSAGDIVVDSGGQAYVSGTTQVGGQQDILLMKLSTSGARLWARTLDGSSHAADWPTDLVAAGGNVYLTGALQSTTGSDVAVAKYSSGGVRRWLRTYDSPVHGVDLGRSITVDTTGAVYVAGSVAASAPPRKGFLGKWDSTGHRKWVRLLYNTAYTGSGDLASAARGPDGTLYVAGWAENPVTEADAVVAAFTSAGTRRWLATWNATTNLDEKLSCVVTGRTPSGTPLVFACGATWPTDPAFIEANALVLRLRP